ncbi:hypothetical protein [Lactiplantibacillus plantarum]|uniref:hypothetical protein n=1 Tax=Lactiplantibacillus plantarum TaxID=1590 RepID=UPI0020BF27E2|nr:hypothetical protein [Lactiplantibacillus plantarum]MCK8451388.1 hypothetical protein [Lactiplantibacillus plantarum]
MENKNIEELIDDKSISAYEIEKNCGVSSSTIINIRNGKRLINNLSQKTVSKLNNYYLKTHKPEQVFWDQKDKSMLLSAINNDSNNHWQVSIREVKYLEGRENIAYMEYPIEIKILSYNSELKYLIEKYWEKYIKIQNRVSTDKKFPIAIQPLYTDYNQVSFISSNEMLSIIESLREYLKTNEITYGDKLESDNDIVLRRTMTAFLYANTTSINYSNCLILTLQPIPHLIPLANY